MFRGKAEKKVVAAGYDPARLPPGQYLTEDFPVLSAGPTPRVTTDRWEFTVTTEVGVKHTWKWQDLLELPDRWPIPSLPVAGRDLLAAGMSPGPEIGVMLKKLEDWWVASDFQPTREELLKRL